MSLEYVWLSYNVGITAFKMGRIRESPLTLCWKCTERIIVAGDVEQIFEIQNTGNYGVERAECNILVFDLADLLRFSKLCISAVSAIALSQIIKRDVFNLGWGLKKKLQRSKFLYLCMSFITLRRIWNENPSFAVFVRCTLFCVHLYGTAAIVL